MKPELQNKRVLVVGLGISGRSAAEFLLSRGAHVFGTDSNITRIQQNAHVVTLESQGLRIVSEHEAIDVTHFDLLIVSPGVPPTHPLYQAAKRAGIEVIGEIELACRFIKQTVLGITGTNGKTTVTLLVAHVLRKCGRSARALGNMGVPLTSEFIDEKGTRYLEIAVVELSSFQLETLHSRVIDAAVVLNITPDHLDRYGNMEEYASSKMHIADCIKTDGALYLEQKCFQEYGYLLACLKPKIYGYSSDCDVSIETFKGLLPLAYTEKPNHDIENLMAAYGLCKEVGITADQFVEAALTFQKPPHRIQFVKASAGVSYYNDSKGTNIDAVIRAVEVMKGPIILIAGGVDKGAPYTPWLEAFVGKVKCICAIGQASVKIQEQLSQQVPVKVFESLEAAVKYAASLAKAGDNVLLSPGCSSYDMFRDYAHRGEEFIRIVERLRT